MMSREEIEELLGPFDRPHLECDGATRVFAWVLKKKGVEFVVKFGRLEFDGEVVRPYYWLELENGLTVDYKARMWLPGVDGVPSGVFDSGDYPKALYVGEEDHSFIVTKTMFNILIRSFGDEDGYDD